MEGSLKCQNIFSNPGNLPFPEAVAKFSSMTFALSKGLQELESTPGRGIVLCDDGNREFPQRFCNTLFLFLLIIFGLKLGFQAIS